MWIVRLALRRPYTIAVCALMVFFLGALSIKSMLVDIFPVIDIPVVGIVWAYNGLPAEDMERRVVLLSERSISTTVNGVSRIESESIPGIGLLRVYFQPGTDIGAAIAQISAIGSTVLRSMPPGMTAPVILQFNAANVPVAQMTMSSETVPEQQIFDWALNFLRMKLFTIPGLAIPAPYGGMNRQINVDVNQQNLLARGLSSTDVVNSLQLSNLILPAGTARIGKLEYNVSMNSSPLAVDQFNQIPVKVVNGAPILLGDVAKITDAFADQTNVVRVNSHRSTYVNILKKSDASTLTVIDSIKNLLPTLRAIAPKGVNLNLDFDQSVFVKAAISSVLHEAVISSILVSMMILLFLGSWRSVIVVCTSIPIAILFAIICLHFTGNTINIMTLGGLSLAIGMLVDDATVEVENIHRNRALGLPLTKAILAGAEQIALPAIMATLAICIVFFPVVLLTGPSRFLFVPMALSVVFSMLASYVLSRTLVPLLSRMLLGAEVPHGTAGHKDIFPKFNSAFERFQRRYEAILEILLVHRRFVLWTCGAIVALTLVLPFIVGTDFFPQTDTGLMKLHFRAPAGTRLEETERLVSEVEKRIHEIIPEEEVATINSMLGIPTSYNLAFVPTDNVGAMDAEILISLKEDHHATRGYMNKIREKLAVDFPDCTVFFQAADIVNQVLNFGVSAPIDVQIDGNDFAKSYELAKKLKDRMKQVPGLADVNIKQVFDYPTLKMNVDRNRAARLGLTQRDVANSMLISLSSSSLVSPSYFLNPANSVNYSVVVKSPLKQINTLQDLLATPITPPGGSVDAGSAPGTVPGAQAERLGNLVTTQNLVAMNEINHNNIQRVLDVTANVDGRDLGSAVRAINAEIKNLGELPKGTNITVHGQGEVMDEAFTKLGFGLIVSVFLVYFLMVVLFQSWLDPFIVIVAVPGALVGILWMLLMTGTTINVESFMGSIMAVGIAASNAILLVSFANDVRVEKNLSPLAAARLAGQTRLRPVLMTALAMIIGMLPAALALGEGGEQNAPLGRAVIGGLLVATIVTLFVIPVVYSILRKDMPTKHLLDERLEAEELAQDGPGSEGERHAS